MLTARRSCRQQRRTHLPVSRDRGAIRALAGGSVVCSLCCLRANTEPEGRAKAAAQRRWFAHQQVFLLVSSIESVLFGLVSQTPAPRHNAHASLFTALRCDSDMHSLALCWLGVLRFYDAVRKRPAPASAGQRLRRADKCLLIHTSLLRAGMHAAPLAGHVHKRPRHAPLCR